MHVPMNAADRVARASIEDQFSGRHLAWAEAGDLRTAEVETIATRGDHLVLLSGVNSISDIVRHSWIGIDRITRDEKVDLSVLFDSGDAERATAEIDRLAGLRES